MSNLGPREKYLIILLGIAILILIIYLAGIRPLMNKNNELRTEQAQLQARLDYYDALKAQNEAMASEIQALEAEISSIERTFVPEINTEAIEQYILNVFEKNNCPYLASVGTENVQSPSFTYPDGTVAEETLNIKRVTVVYSTTDGFNIADYNRDASVSLIDPATGRLTEDNAAIDAYLEQMHWQGTSSITGYDQFIAALQEIKEENPGAIKIADIKVEGVSGYILMTASIDFYSANLINRVSAATSTDSYVEWAGETNYATGAGFVGMPFYVDNPNSAWYGYYLPLQEATAGDRPFATAFSNAFFSQAAAAAGLPTTLEIEEVDQPATPDVTDEVTED